MDSQRLFRRLSRQICTISNDPFLQLADAFNGDSEDGCNQRLLYSRIQDTMCKLNPDVCTVTCSTVSYYL